MSDISNAASARLGEFAAGLRAVTAPLGTARPFVCKGHPLACRVALVGANPSSATPFWPSWHDERGMDRPAWLDAYRMQHGGRFRRSRAAIERLVARLDGPLLELNAHASQSRRLAQLAVAERDTQVLAFMLNAVRPLVVICAGRHAHRAVDALALPWPHETIEAPHFIYWGRDSEARLCAEIARLLQANPANGQARERERPSNAPS